MAHPRSLQAYLRRRSQSRRNSRPRHERGESLACTYRDEHSVRTGTANCGTRLSTCDRCPVIALAAEGKARRKAERGHNARRVLHGVLDARYVGRVKPRIFRADTSRSCQRSRFRSEHAEISDSGGDQENHRRCDGKFDSHAPIATGDAAGASLYAPPLVFFVTHC